MIVFDDNTGEPIELLPMVASYATSASMVISRMKTHVPEDALQVKLESGVFKEIMEGLWMIYQDRMAKKRPNSETSPSNKKVYKATVRFMKESKKKFDGRVDDTIKKWVLSVGVKA